MPWDGWGGGVGTEGSKPPAFCTYICRVPPLCASSITNYCVMLCNFPSLLLPHTLFSRLLYTSRSPAPCPPPLCRIGQFEVNIMRSSTHPVLLNVLLLWSSFSSVSVLHIQPKLNFFQLSGV